MGKIGRPPGRKKTEKIEVMIEPTKKQIFVDLVQEIGSSASVEINKMISEYIYRNTRERRDLD